MADIVKQIPFVPMPKNSAMCGAACLKMLFGYYGRFRDMNTIWSGIQMRDRFTGRVNCRTYKMVQYAQSANLFSIAVTCDEPLRLIDVCLENDIGMIPLYIKADSTPFAHFSVIVGRDGVNILLNDPEEKASIGTRFPISESELVRKMMRVPNGEIGKSFSFVLVAKPDILVSNRFGVLYSGEKKAIKIPTCISNLPISVLCLDNDQWFRSISSI